MKIIILTGKFGMGHYSAANALAEQIKTQDPAAEIIVTDLYELAFSKYCNLLYGAYSSLVGKGCRLYNLAYKNATSDKHQNQHNVNMLSKYFLKCIEKHFQEEKPNVVIATYSLCAYLISEYKRITGSRIPLVTCITDVTTHSVWTNPGTDLYLVAEECTKKSLVAQGVSPEIIALSGIPVRQKFHCDQEMQKNKRNLERRADSLSSDSVKNSDTKELLIMGGGLGLLPQSPEFYKKLDSLDHVHTTVITGKNKTLYKKLAGKYRNITILGYTDRVDQLMRDADLMITKPGGITIFEAIYSQVPLLICKPFLEQEIKNGKFIEENHLGIVLEKKPEKAVDEIQKVLSNETLLKKVKENMAKISRKLNHSALFAFLETHRDEEQQWSGSRGIKKVNRPIAKTKSIRKGAAA